MNILGEGLRNNCLEDTPFKLETTQSVYSLHIRSEQIKRLSISCDVFSAGYDDDMHFYFERDKVIFIHKKSLHIQKNNKEYVLE